MECSSCHPHRGGFPTYTPLFMSDESGAAVWRREQEPFGATTFERGTATENLRFPGQYWDEETGKHYSGFRTYDAKLGRYLEADPIGQAGGVNAYSYTNVNPTRWIDVYGLTTEIIFTPLDEPVIIDDGEFNARVSVIINNEFQGSYYARTIPSDPEAFATIASGVYRAKRGYHHGRDDYPTIKIIGEVPTVGMNPAHSENGDPGCASGINIHHAGRNNYTGTFMKNGRMCGVSQGCPVTPIDDYWQFLYQVWFSDDEYFDVIMIQPDN